LLAVLKGQLPDFDHRFRYHRRFLQSNCFHWGFMPRDLPRVRHTGGSRYPEARLDSGSSPE
ncbi:hypothetical protein, partial [Candidatus Methylomirabilis sp.]|uniref:hypothetical protein n=1 Tax=Candidatus Methylomirabilis sp. TaxID=2032687 RepID=UPI003C774000